MKDLDSEFSQFKQFIDLQAKFQIISEKHEALEKKYDDVKSKKDHMYKCGECDLIFTTLGELRKYERSHKSSNGPFQCDKCERVFNEEWKLKVHRNIHGNYACENCDNTFKNEDTKSKHKKIRKCIGITSTMERIVYLIKNAYFCTKLQNHGDMVIVARESFVCSVMMSIMLLKILTMKRRMILKIKHFQTHHKVIDQVKV